MSRTVRFLLPAALAIAAIGSSACADVVYTNFGPGDTFNTGIGYTISGAGSNAGTNYSQGDLFTAGSTVALTQIDVAFFLAQGTPRVNLSLYTAAVNGQLGTLIETISNVGPISPTPGVISASSALNPVLTAGQSYWLVASPVDNGSWVAWNYNSTGATGSHYLNTNGTPSYAPNTTAGAFRVIGRVVPEPASLALCGLGLAGIAGFLRLRRRTAVA